MYLQFMRVCVCVRESVCVVVPMQPPPLGGGPRANRANTPKIGHIFPIIPPLWDLKIERVFPTTSPLWNLKIALDS